MRTIYGLWLPLCSPGVSVASGLTVLQVENLCISHLSGGGYLGQANTINNNSLTHQQLS